METQEHKRQNNINHKCKNPKYAKHKNGKIKMQKAKKMFFFQNKNFLLARKLLGDYVGFMPIF